MKQRIKAGSFALLLWAGCQPGLLTITVEEEASATVPEASLLEDLLGDLGFSAFLEMNVMESQELQNQGVEPGDVANVYLTSFTLEATSPAGADLSFLSGLTVWVEAPDLARVQIASASAFPEGQPLVALDLEPVDLADYVVSESMTFSTEVEGHRPPDETTLTARFSLDVEVTAQGACNQVAGDSGTP